MSRCHTCDSAKDLERQIAGFWFCFHCLPAAVEKGAAYWTRLYAAIYPWR
jgi:ribosomal protein L37AE/L43A